MAYQSPAQRSPYREKFRLTGGLPTHSSAVEEKVSLTGRHASGNGWTSSVQIPNPRGGHGWSITLPIPPQLLRLVQSKLGHRRALVGILLFTLFGWFLLFVPRKSARWPPVLREEKATLVFSPSELRRIWQWEIASGHYPSSRPSMCCLGTP